MKRGKLKESKIEEQKPKINKSVDRSFLSTLRLSGGASARKRAVVRFSQLAGAIQKETYKSSGLRPVFFAIRANIRGPISSLA
jgi:hypothetical protein